MTCWMGRIHNDFLKGGTGNDTLIGGSSARMRSTGGWLGNDLDTASRRSRDHVIELAAGGTDTIQTNVNNLSLATYDNVEVLVLGGLLGINGSGSDRSDLIVGNIGQERPDRWSGQ